MVRKGIELNKTHMSAEAGVVEGELNALKDIAYERSLKAGEINFIGVIGGEGSKNWTGGIKLKDRLERGALSTDRLAEALDFMSACYVKVQKDAYIRCIDGRIKLGYDDNDPADYGRALGPQVAGGTPIQAVTYRISMGGGEDSYTNADLRKDTEEVFQKVKKLGYLPGDHVDQDHAVGKTGCGAVDGCEKHCENIGVSTIKEVESLTKAVMGKDFNSEHFDSNIASFTRLASNKETYFAEKNQILAELVESNPESAPVLEGSHNEIAVILNLVKSETFHTDHFASKFDGDVQAFNYDVWHTFEVAKELFPDDEVRQSKYVHGRLMLAVTALMDLTDGTLLLGVRTPTQT